MPLNLYDDCKVSLRRPHRNGDLDIVRASYTCRKVFVWSFFEWQFYTGFTVGIIRQHSNNLNPNKMQEQASRLTNFGSIKLLVFSYPSVSTFGFIKIVVLSIHNICFG